jgi:hypothetical protein
MYIPFNVRTCKSSGTCCGRNLNGPKFLKLRTFRKNYRFSDLCHIDIRTKNSLKDNNIFYTYPKEQNLQMKISCDYFVMKRKISSLLYILWNSKGLTTRFSRNLRYVDFLKNSRIIYNKLLFRLYASVYCVTLHVVITPLAPFSAHTLTRVRMPLLKAVHDIQTNITLFTVQGGAPGFLI